MLHLLKGEKKGQCLQNGELEGAQYERLLPLLEIATVGFSGLK